MMFKLSRRTLRVLFFNLKFSAREAAARSTRGPGCDPSRPWPEECFLAARAKTVNFFRY